MTKEEFEELYPDTVVYSNPSYETALVGVTMEGVAVYDYEKMVQYLVDTDGMTEEEAA